MYFHSQVGGHIFKTGFATEIYNRGTPYKYIFPLCFSSGPKSVPGDVPPTTGGGGLRACSCMPCVGAVWRFGGSVSVVGGRCGRYG